MTHVDAIVVGSGPNGLAAAIALQEHGLEVLVLEEQEHLGGCLHTDELTLPGFRHDVFSAVHPAAVASPVFARWPLGQHGLEWVHPPVAMAHPLADGRAVTLDRDIERTRQALNAVAPGDGDSWARFAHPYLRAFGALRSTMLGAFPPVNGSARLLLQLKPQGVLELSRLLMTSAHALAHQLFASDSAAAWLFGSSLHGDVPPSQSGSAMLGVYLKLLGHAVGYPSPRGGAGALADALVRHLRALGGSARTGARVERVLVRRGRVQGVEVAGEHFFAKRVLCNVVPSQLLALARGLPSAYARRLAHYRHGPGVVKIDWALDGPIPWIAEAAREAGTVHVAHAPGDLVEQLDAIRRGHLPRNPFLILGQQSLADPSRAPHGKHTAWAYTRVPARCDERQIEQHVERIEAQVSAFAPSFRERILGRHLLTPSGLESRNRNLVGGDIGGGSYALDQLVLRPLARVSPYRTPIRGLYLASAATYPGGSVHGVCGAAAARCALQDARIPMR